MAHCYKKRGQGFIQNPIRNVCAKFKVDRLFHFCTAAPQAFTTQTPFP